MKTSLRGRHHFVVSLILWLLGISCLMFFGFGDYLKFAGYAFSMVLIMLPFYIYSRSPRIRKNVSLEYINLIQLVAAIVSFLNLLGSLAGYYDPTYSGYDKFTHFINPALIFSITPILPIFFQKHFFGRVNLWFVLLANFVLIIFGSFIWEFYEYAIDSIFEGADMLGKFGEVYYDTLYDLLADFAGGLTASLLIYRYFYGYILKNTLEYRHNESK